MTGVVFEDGVDRITLHCDKCGLRLDRIQVVPRISKEELETALLVSAASYFGDHVDFDTKIVICAACQNVIESSSEEKDAITQTGDKGN